MFTYKEALKHFGGRHGIRKAIKEGTLIHVGYDTYSTEASYDTFAAALKRYPLCIVTGQTAYYILGLSDIAPEKIDLASKRGGAKINNQKIKQHFIPEKWLDVGRSSVTYNGAVVPIYDQERMLVELMRNRKKMPYDVYKDIVMSYRKRANEIDIYKLQDYADRVPRGKAYLDMIMKEVY